MEIPASNADANVEPDVALERYAAAVSAIEGAAGLSAEQALEALLARDALRALSPETPEPTRHMAALIELDQRLQRQAGAIAKAAPLETWRQSRQPDEDAWWWFFQPPEADHGAWDRFDWVWNGLTAGALALAASFMMGIYQALSVGGLSWKETFSTILQGAGLALIGQGALTATGQQKIKAMLAFFHIPPRFHSEATCAFALCLLGIVFGLHRALPNYFYDRGQALYEQGQLTDAEERFIQGQTIEPSDPRFNIALGTVYESLGSLDQALAEYQQALQQGMTRAFNDIGRIHVQRFDPVKKRTEPIVAETYLRMGLQRAESNPDTDANTRFQLHRNLGWALIAQQRYAEAEIELERALVKDGEIQGKQIGGGMEACFLAYANAERGDAKRALERWHLCRGEARPETINEYKWFLSVGQHRLANCIDTSSVVAGLDKLPVTYNAACREPIERVVSTGDAVPPLETLRVQLHDRLNQSWSGSDRVQAELAYRVSVASDGTIIAYEPLNAPASEHEHHTPLPTLRQHREAADPQATFKVVLRPAGAFDVTLLH